MPARASPAERTFLRWAKRSMIWGSDGGDQLDLLTRLCEPADILIHDGLPEHLRGSWPAHHAARAPRLIQLVISPFGESGPYAGYRGDSGAVQALAGLAYTKGDPDREPLIMQPNVAEYFAGAEGLIAIMAALTWRRDTGDGCTIDLSVLDSAVAFDEYNLILPPGARRGPQALLLARDPRLPDRRVPVQRRLPDPARWRPLRTSSRSSSTART